MRSLCLAALLIIARLHLAAGSRTLLACGQRGCLRPKIDPAAVGASFVLDATFTSPYNNYAATTQGFQMAYGVCYAIGCNYRNMTVAFLGGDTVSKQDFAYNFTLYVAPANASQLQPFITALEAGLPCTYTSLMQPPSPVTACYGMAFVQGGSISQLSNLSFGFGRWSPPPAQPAAPPASPARPPSPALRTPPRPPPPAPPPQPNVK